MARANTSLPTPVSPCSNRAAFTFANKVVDGHYFLLDGAPGKQSWIEDTNEHLTGSDLFSADPRGLLTGAAQEADFKQVGTATVGTKERVENALTSVYA